MKFINIRELSTGTSLMSSSSPGHLEKCPVFDRCNRSGPTLGTAGGRAHEPTRFFQRLCLISPESSGSMVVHVSESHDAVFSRARVASPGSSRQNKATWRVLPLGAPPSRRPLSAKYRGFRSSPRLPDPPRLPQAGRMPALPAYRGSRHTASQVAKIGNWLGRFSQRAQP